MAEDASSEPIGNIAGKPAGSVAQGAESSTGGEGGAPEADPRPGASTLSGAAGSGPSEAEIAAEESDDPELARQGADVQSEPV